MSPRAIFRERFLSTKKLKNWDFFRKFEQKFSNELVKTSLYAPEEQFVIETLEKTINKYFFWTSREKPYDVEQNSFASFVQNAFYVSRETLCTNVFLK